MGPVSPGGVSSLAPHASTRSGAGRRLGGCVVSLRYVFRGVVSSSGRLRGPSGPVRPSGGVLVASADCHRLTRFISRSSPFPGGRCGRLPGGLVQVGVCLSISSSCSHGPACCLRLAGVFPGLYSSGDSSEVGVAVVPAVASAVPSLPLPRDVLALGDHRVRHAGRSSSFPAWYSAGAPSRLQASGGWDWMCGVAPTPPCSGRVGLPDPPSTCAGGSGITLP